jgi:ATP/maltotriose-dependent transcriptional regulator MalT
VDSLLGLGVCYYQQGHYAQAIDIEQQALQLCTTQGSVGMEVLVCCQLAEAYLASGQSQLARTYAERAVAIDQEVARPHDYAEALRIYADVLLVFRELDAALTAAASAYTIIQPMLEESAAEQETAYYVLTTLQHVHAARGEHEQAAAWAAQAAALHDNSDSAAP